ncbi:MAG TPA: hypothetical protein VL172_08580, partial [Kofleriaceae bacterium]|nr:hypothetical protein [Kofleriaceae bacterium]
HDCHDPMTYLGFCGKKYYRDAQIACGRYDVEPCVCGGNAQNSHRKLLAQFGPSSNTIPGPTVDLQLPAAGDMVQNGFLVYAETSDPRGSERAELRINGYKWLTADADELFIVDQNYTFRTPDTIPDGYQNIEVRAYNDLEVYTSATVQALKGQPCAGAGNCLDGQECTDGACAWPAPTGELGDACARNQDCISDLCPTNNGDSFCSQDCTPQVTGTCPDGFECLALGTGAGVCWPQAGGGCCSTSGQRTGWPQLALFGAVLLLVSTRRRRAS